MRMFVTGTLLVVPTHVGVNRDLDRQHPRDGRCPHTRGGEPVQLAQVMKDADVVPTHVGVNRAAVGPRSARRTLSPHTWG